VSANEDFLSGHSGEVSGIRATGRAVLMDAWCGGAAWATLTPWRLGRAAGQAQPRRVLVLSIERPEEANLLAEARTELAASHHHVQLLSSEVGPRGKFENLNALLERESASGHDWLLVVDDDVQLPRGFLDQFLFLAERFGLRMAQPAHRHFSHAAFDVTRRRPGAVARQTAFVEIGPVTAFHSSVFDALLPFPGLRFGWGLDVHWSAVAAEHGWPIGVVDATPIRHGLRQIASSYDRSAAIAEAREFLAGRAYTPARDAQRTLRTYRRW
jgi:hypothetical protein